MKIKINRYFPPGIDVDVERNFTRLLVIASIVFSLGFLVKYNTAYYALFDEIGENRDLIKGVVIEPFSVIMNRSMYLFFISIIGEIGLILKHYLYYYQDSKPIYLMKRLPKSKELLIQVIGYPLSIILLICAIGTLLYFIYAYIYFHVTPSPCMARW